MDKPFGDFAQDLFGTSDYACTSHVASPRFSQFVQRTENLANEPIFSHTLTQDATISQVYDEDPAGIQIAQNAVTFSGETLPNFKNTRQEVLVLTNVPGRYSQTLINQPLFPTVVDDLTPTTRVTTSSYEDLGGSIGTEVVLQGNDQGPTTSRGKRRRLKYSLTGSIFKRHPGLKFSAIGPLDNDKSPYKWWCRVFRVELSLMSRGCLELISHYRSDSHLLKEHRVRMEVPWMPHFDEEERELLGVALQNAKKKAKVTYPIPPQLHSYRPLVGQESVPDFSAAISTTEKIVSQINFLEFGWRHGGSVSSLTGMHDELVRLTSSDHLSVQN